MHVYHISDVYGARRMTMFVLDISIDIVHNGQETTDDNQTDQTSFVRRGVIERERDNESTVRRVWIVDERQIR